MFLLGANFVRSKYEWQRGIFYVFWGNFINIRGNQSKIVGKLKNLGAILKLLEANVLVEFENVSLIGGIFYN